MGFINALPQELFLHIASLLNVQDVYRLRQTSKRIALSTRDKSLWLSIMASQALLVPLPVQWQSEGFDVLHVSALEIEQTVASALVVSQRWPQRRQRPPVRAKPSQLGESILLLQTFHDRWLICAYGEGVISLWDLGQPYDPHAVTAFLGIIKPSDQLSWSCVAGAPAADGSIILAVTKTGGPTITRIISVLPGKVTELGIAYETLALITHPLPLFVRAVDPSQCIVVFSHACYIEVYQWNTQLSASISTQSEDLDELWNGILGVHVHEQHVLCVKARSVELHSIPMLQDRHVWLASGQPEGPGPRRKAAMKGSGTDPGALPSSGLVHHFSTRTFRGYALSSPVTISATTTSFNLLGYDVLQGICLHRVCVEKTADDAMLPAIFRVEPLGQHLMTATTQEGSSSTTVTSTRSGGFVSACCLGRGGQRGIWIERSRGSMTRSVTAFSVPDNPTSNEVGDEVGMRRLQGHVVHQESSYDLRDDLNHCAVCEVSGVIVLGTRQGELQILRP